MAAFAVVIETFVYPRISLSKEFDSKGEAVAALSMHNFGYIFPLRPGTDLCGEA